MNHPDRVAAGSDLPVRSIRPTEVQLFRFSAATWNPHRIHFDRPYAQSEGYPDVLVQSHLHASYLTQYVLDWAGPDARLTKFEWRNRAIATPRDTLLLRGTVADVVLGGEHDGHVVIIDLTCEKAPGTVCVTAQAEVRL